MEQRKPIEALAAEVIEKLEQLNYAHNTICGFRTSFNRICAFSRERDELYFSEEFGKEYLREKCCCITDYYLETFPPKAKQAIRSIRLLGDYQLHGVIIRRIVKRKGYVKPPQFEEALTAYEKECENNEYSRRGMRTRLQRLFFFVDYLALCKVIDVSEITPKIISDYVITICPKHEKSIAAILTTLRVFLRFLYPPYGRKTSISFDGYRIFATKSYDYYGKIFRKIWYMLRANAGNLSISKFFR